MPDSVLPMAFFMQQTKEDQMKEEDLKLPFQFLNLLLSENIILLRTELKPVIFLIKEEETVW